MAAVALTAISVTGGTGIDRGAAAEPTGPLEYVGELAKPFKAVGTGEGMSVLGFDAAARRMYVVWSDVTGDLLKKVLVTYDLSTTIPTLVATRDVSGTWFNAVGFTSAIAPRRGTGYAIITADKSTADIRTFDLSSEAPMKVWSVAAKLPGFFPSGLTYSEEDDRIYAVGEMSGSYFVLSSTFTAGRKPAGVVPTVAAFDPGTGDLLWARPVPECGQVLYTLHLGSLVARSSAAVSPRIMFACGTGSVGVGGDTMPGQAGVVELDITPQATMADAANFDLRFHPISGSYFDGGQNGFGYYDHGSDRLFVQSLSLTTPGAWVFDARLGGWAGFITAPKPLSYGGINEGNGHYYMGGGDVVVAADGRASPPQSGVLGHKRFAPEGFVFGDPGSDRVFIPRNKSKNLIVARDLTRSAQPLERPDYDAQTDDVEETPGTFVSFSGDTGGFGARVTAVGDTSAAAGPSPFKGVPSTSDTPLTAPTGTKVVLPTTQPGVPVPSATRGVLFARVPTASVQPSGAAASAQAASSDTTTGQAVDQHGISWPFEPRTCLDGGDGDHTEPAESVGGRAEVQCRLAGYESTGSARQAGVDTGPVSIGDTRIDTKVKRTAKDGMSTVTTSSATGIRVEVSGAGTLEIGKAETVARTSAHGRSGTATAEWTRRVADVTVTAGGQKYTMAGCAQTVKHDGRKATPSGDGGACDALAEAVRRLLQVRVRLLFPTPAVQATARGAFARVGQTDTDAAREVTVNDQGKVYPNDATTRRTVPGLQVDVYNDSTERSRYIVQLAGAENSSIYTVNTSPDDAPCDMGGCIPGGFDGLPPLDTAEVPSSSNGSMETAASFEGTTLGSDISTPVATGGGRRPSTSGGRSDGLDGLILARRGLGDGGLMASFVLLVAAAVGAVTRRRRLLSVLAA